MLKKINSSYIIKLLIRIIIFLVITFGFLSPIIFDHVSFATRYIMFTGLSNFIIVVEYFVLIILMLFKVDISRKSIYILRLISTGSILLTFMIFGFLLTPIALVTKEYNPFTLSSIMQHFVNPILAILEFLLLDPSKEKIKKLYSFTPLSVSLIYCVCIEIRGAISTNPSQRVGSPNAKYPYFFLDPYFMGVWFESGDLGINFGVVPIILVLIIFDFLLCLLLVIIKNKIDDSIKTN